MTPWFASKSLVLIIALTLVFPAPLQAAEISEGSKCTKLNETVKNSKDTYKCLKSGKKLILVLKFKKCSDAIAAKRAPILKEIDPLLYLANSGLDRDKDGIACDK